jgi:hypothetical protein
VEPAAAQATTLAACTRAFGKWIELRDASLRRLEAEPTVLGLGNTWCTTSPARLADLRSRLATVRAECAAVAEGGKQRVEGLLVQAVQLLDRVAPCQGVGDDAATWQIQVQQSPPPVTAEDKEPKASEAQARAEPSAPVPPKPAGGDRRKVAGSPSAPVSPPPKKETAPAPPVAATEPAPAAPVAAAKPAAPATRVLSNATAAPGAPRPTAAAPESAAARPAAASDDDDCLVVTKASPATYLIENRYCPPHSILTAIELPQQGQSVRCFTKKVSAPIAIAGEVGMTPQINFQCSERFEWCTEQILRGMFPECQPG